jgi:transposase InsO family protein
MPWKETCVVDLRTEFAMRALGEQISFSDLCREYGISRKTGYKWKERFVEQGLSGLVDQSRRPQSSPSGLDEQTVCRIVKLKQAHLTWGPRKIRQVYARIYRGFDLPSESSFKRVLDQAGLVKRRRRRPQSESGRLTRRLVAERPNQIWTVDFKGWWRVGTRARFEPLTVCDAYSRYVLCARALPDCRSESVRREFERLFARHGLPEVIRSDNGSPFASARSPLGLTQLSSWWLALGIDLDRISPGSPQENGSHERMHGDIALELESSPDSNVQAQQGALDVWRETYNHERPHEALGLRVPAELYADSPRRYEAGEVELEYPLGYLRRRVGSNGMFSVHGIRIQFSEALKGWEIGLERLSGSGYGLWFCRLRMGEVDLETRSFTVATDLEQRGGSRC